MARYEKRVVLRTIEDEEPEEDPVVRLGPEKEPEQDDDDSPVRLGPMRPPKPAFTGSVAPSEFRTHQPGIEALIEINDPQADPDATENEWNQKPLADRPVPWGWFALVGLLFASAVIWSSVSVHKAEKMVDEIRMQTTQTVVKNEQQEQEAAQLVEDIESAVRSYFSAGSVETRLRWVRHRERVEPLMRGYEALHPVKPSVVREIRMLSPVTIRKSTDFWVCSVALVTGEQQQMIVEITPEGPRIDWETQVVHQPMPWDDFARQRPEGSSFDFRVYLEPSVFFSHEFADEKQWVSYRLTTLHADAVLYGYARRDSQVARDLAALTKDAPRASAILRLQIPSGLQSPSGVAIEAVISERWLLLDPPQED